MFNPLYDPARRQKVVCDGCGKEISLSLAQETKWAIYSVFCNSCGRYALESKFKLKSGQWCPRCHRHELSVLKRFAATEQMRELLADEGFELYRFIGEGQLVKI
jgi:hypothetical protein